MKRIFFILVIVLLFPAWAYADFSHSEQQIEQAHTTALDVRAADGIIDSDGAGNITAQPRSRLIPAGGTTNQVLKKVSDADYDTQWAADEGGAGSSPGGETGSVQYNDGAGGFGGDTNLKYDPATGIFDAPIVRTGEIQTTAADGDRSVGAFNTTDKTTPSEGDMWYNSTDKTWRYFDGTQNVDVPGAGGGGVEGVTGTAPITVDNSDPANPIIGIDGSGYAPASHVSDTSNPHQVTAAQVGAPASSQVGNIIVSSDCASETGVQNDLCFQIN